MVKGMQEGFGVITFMGSEYDILLIGSDLHIEFYWYVEDKYDNGIVSCVNSKKVYKIVPWAESPKVMALLHKHNGKIVVKQDDEPF